MKRKYFELVDIKQPDYIPDNVFNSLGNTRTTTNYIRQEWEPILTGKTSLQNGAPIDPWRTKYDTLSDCGPSGVCSI